MSTAQLDFDVREKHVRLTKERTAFKNAHAKLLGIKASIKAELHEDVEIVQLQAAIDHFEFSLLGIDSQIKRIETIGR